MADYPVRNLFEALAGDRHLHIDGLDAATIGPHAKLSDYGESPLARPGIGDWMAHRIGRQQPYARRASDSVCELLYLSSSDGDVSSEVLQVATQATRIIVATGMRDIEDHVAGYASAIGRAFQDWPGRGHPLLRFGGKFSITTADIPNLQTPIKESIR